MALTLNPKVAGRSDQNALYLATACDLAYFPQDRGKAEFAAQLGLNATLISVDNTQCYVCENDSVIVLAFRGSEAPNSIDDSSIAKIAINFLAIVLRSNRNDLDAYSVLPIEQRMQSASTSF